MSELLMAFYGDDFTGSTDAMESLEIAGVRTVLFTHPPTRDELAGYPNLQAYGVAGRTRAMSPQLMRDELQSALDAIRATGASLVHYKVCSTFDSSPTVGSIGCAIDVGAEVFGTTCVPVVGGAPHLGRYCVFGNLFARGSGDLSPVRLDRHPNMSNHPVTPMDEADLRLHLGKQTQKPIALFDITRLSDPDYYLKLIGEHRGAVLMDFVDKTQGLLIGMHLLQHARRESPLFVVGSSGVEAALTAYWTRGEFETHFPVAGENGPLLVAVGSCSPVTARQLASAEAGGFALLTINANEDADSEIARDATTLLKNGQCVVIHTGGTTSRDASREVIGAALAKVTRDVLLRSGVRRLLVAGGDTSGQIADKLQIRSLEMIAPIVRGAPLCRARSKLPDVDGIEVVFKGGQIGGDDFFGVVQRGSPSGT